MTAHVPRRQRSLYGPGTARNPGTDEQGERVQFGVAQPSEDVPAVIVADGDDGLMALTEDDGEPRIFGSRDPEVGELVEAATRAYGPSARAMPVSEFKKLTGDAG